MKPFNRLASFAASVVGLLSLVGCSGNPAPAVNRQAPAGTGFRMHAFNLPGQSQHKTTVFVPFDYTPDKAWPAIVFLQGMGEGGGDGVKNTTVGLGPYIAKRPKDFKYIAIFPQSPSGWWTSEKSQDLAVQCVDEAAKHYKIDRSRVYLTGLSTGGYGCWALGARYPERWAAIVPICAHNGEAYASKLTRTPIWAFANSGDFIVWPNSTRNTVDAINKAGGKAKQTIWGAMGHDAWSRTYDSREFWTWLAQQRR